MKFKIHVSENVTNAILRNYAIKNVPLPAKFTPLKRFQKRPSYFIIHDSNCLANKTAALSVDNEQPAIGEIKLNNIAIGGQKDINYHFLVDKIGKDWEIITARPISFLCEHNDISSAYKYAIHILFLTDYTVDMPKTRLYQVVAYKCLSPLMKMLHMGTNAGSIIKFHNEVIDEPKLAMLSKDIKTTDPKMRKYIGRDIKKCPGDFLVKALLINQTKRYL